MVRKSSQAVADACKFSFKQNTPYLTACLRFFIARYLLLARSLDQSERSLANALDRLSDIAPDIAVLDDNALQKKSRELDFSINCPLQQMQKTLAEYPDVLTYLPHPA